MLVDETSLEFSVRPGITTMKLKSAGMKTTSIFREDFSFDQLGKQYKYII